MAKPIPRPIKKNGRWHIRYTNEYGKRVKDSYASHADAEYALADAMKHVKAVKRGLEAPTPPDKTFNEICDYWEKYRAHEKRDQRNDLSILKVHLRPFFGSMLLRDITVQKVDQFKKLKARPEVAEASNGADAKPAGDVPSAEDDGKGSGEKGPQTTGSAQVGHRALNAEVR